MPPELKHILEQSWVQASTKRASLMQIRVRVHSPFRIKKPNTQIFVIYSLLAVGT